MNQSILSFRAALPARLLHRLQVPSGASLLAVFLASVFAPAPASAGNLSQNPAVNNAAAVSELINAITSANKSGGPVTINLFSNGVYTLTQAQNWEYGPNGLPQITGNLTINGCGATLQRATNAPGFRFFYISGGLSFTSKKTSGLPAGNLALLNLTLSNGCAIGGNGYGQGGGGAGMGGAIFNQGTLSLDNVNLFGNTALGGNCITNGLAGGGGGIGGNGGSPQGGGFGGTFSGDGGQGGAGATGGGGGGGGFRPSDHGSAASSTNSGAGGGLGGLATIGDGGNGGSAVSTTAGSSGGAYGYGGKGSGGSGTLGGGGGGIGGGGGHGGSSGTDGNGGFGGGGGGGADLGGSGGFGGGGGSGEEGSLGGFAAGNGNPEDSGGGGGGGMGGAIFNHRGSITLCNCTLTGNTSQGGVGFDAEGVSLMYGAGVGGSGYGGAIFNLNGTLSLVCSTVVSNATFPGATTTWDLNSQGEYVLTNIVSGGANGGAIYNLAYGNRIEDGSASVATVCLANSLLAGSIGSANDLANNEINGNHTNTATITFSTNNLTMTCCNIHNAGCTGAPTGALCNPPPSGGSLPVVSLVLVANHPVLCWSTNFPSCSLQATSALPAAGSWTSVPGTPGIAAGQFVIPDTSAAGNKFYRLAVP